MKKLYYIALTALLGLSNTSQAATLIFEGNILTGVNDVIVNGQNYNVRTGNQYTNSVYTEKFAQDASIALAGLFGPGGSPGEFQGTLADTQPWLTKGCSNGQGCSWATTYSLNGTHSLAALFTNEEDDSFDVADTLDFSFDIASPSLNTPLTLTEWSPAKINPVPAPAAIFMFAPVLFGILRFRRKTA